MNRWTIAVLGGLLAVAARPAASEDAAPSAAVASPKKDPGPKEKGPKGDWRLGLSDEQAAKMKAVKESARAEAKPLHDALKVAVEKLRWQVDAKSDDKAIAETLAEIDKNRRAMREFQEKTDKRMDEILTVQQRARRVLLGPGGRPMPGYEGEDAYGRPPRFERAERRGRGEGEDGPPPGDRPERGARPDDADGPGDAGPDVPP